MTLTNPTYVLILAFGIAFAYKIVRTILARAKATKLRGPPAKSWLFGIGRRDPKKESAQLFEEWTNEYGPVFHVPSVAGAQSLVVCDPKAIAHFYTTETYTYVKTAAKQAGMEITVCDSAIKLIVCHAESISAWERRSLGRRR